MLLDLRWKISDEPHAKYVFLSGDMYCTPEYELLTLVHSLSDAELKIIPVGFRLVHLTWSRASPVSLREKYRWRRSAIGGLILYRCIVIVAGATVPLASTILCVLVQPVCDR